MAAQQAEDGRSTAMLTRLPVTDEVPWVEEDEPPEPGPLPPDPLGDAWRGHDDVWPEADGEPAPADRLPRAPGDWLPRTSPGPGLAAALEHLDPATASEYELVEMMAGYYRVASWAHSNVTHLAGHLSRRPALNPRSPLPGDTTTLNVTAEEIAPRLGISRFAARRMVEAAGAFRLKLEGTGIALHEGRIDYAKACVLVRLLADQPDDVAWEVEQLVLPDATHQTVTQLEKAITKAIIAVDPHRATARARKARASRRVDHPRPLPDGMASMLAILPATDAAGLDLALEAAARAAKAAGDTRTIPQLRADAMALLGHGALEHGFIGVPEAGDAGPGGPGGAPPAGPGGGDSAEPDDAAAGPSEATAPEARDATGAEPSEAMADEPGNATACEPNDAPAAEPGHTAPDDPGGPHPDEPPRTAAPAAGPDDAGSGQSPAFQTGSSFLRTPHMPLGTIGGRRAQVHVTIPLSVLIPPQLLRHPESPEPPDQGDTCAPDLPEDWYPGPTPAEVAELDGYGPITPDVARALAYSADTWRRLITDPLSGRLLDVGRTRYRPPAEMAEFVRLRDGSCVSPTCSTPARSCQLDHVCPWYFGGITSADNLAPECERDHHVKSSGAFQLEHLGAGTFVWTTPSGHRYRRDHTGRITMLGGAAFGDSPTF